MGTTSMLTADRRSSARADCFRNGDSTSVTCKKRNQHPFTIEFVEAKSIIDHVASILAPNITEESVRCGDFVSIMLFPIDSVLEIKLTIRFNNIVGQMGDDWSCLVGLRPDFDIFLDDY